MKFTISQQRAIEDVVFDEVLVIDGNNAWVVDEVRQTREGITVFAAPKGSESRRRSFDFKRGDKVTVEPGPDESAKLVTALAAMIGDTLAHEVSAYGNGFSVELSAAKGGSDKMTRTWTLTVEP